LPHLHKKNFEFAKGRMRQQETASKADEADGVLVTPEEVDVVATA
jgi:hypothetical protein